MRLLKSGVLILTINICFFYWVTVADGGIVPILLGG